MVSINGIAIKAKETKPGKSFDVSRFKVAGSAKTKNYSNGEKNKRFSLLGYVTSQADLEVLEAALVGGTVVYIDKFNNSYNVNVIDFLPTLKQHNVYHYSLSLEEVD